MTAITSPLHFGPDQRQRFLARIASAAFGELPAIAAEFGVTVSTARIYRRRLRARYTPEERAAWAASVPRKAPDRRQTKPTVGRPEHGFRVGLTDEEHQRLRAAADEVIQRLHQLRLEEEARKGNVAALIQYALEFRARLPLVEARLPPEQRALIVAHLEPQKGAPGWHTRVTRSAAPAADRSNGASPSICPVPAQSPWTPD